MWQKLVDLWNWFDGKKSVIGLMLLALSALITQWVIGVNNFHPDWLNRVIDNLDYLGNLFLGGGIIHKLAKLKQNKTDEQE